MNMRWLACENSPATLHTQLANPKKGPSPGKGSPGLLPSSSFFLGFTHNKKATQASQKETRKPAANYKGNWKTHLRHSTVFFVLILYSFEGCLHWRGTKRNATTFEVPPSLDAPHRIGTHESIALPCAPEAQGIRAPWWPRPPRVRGPGAPGPGPRVCLT